MEFVDKNKATNIFEVPTEFKLFNIKNPISIFNRDGIFLSYHKIKDLF